MGIAIDLYRRSAWDELSRKQRLELALKLARVEPNDQLRRRSSEATSTTTTRVCGLLPGADRLLKAAGRYRTCLISNGQTDRQREKLRRLSIDGRFDHVLISEEIGVRKPDPAILPPGARSH